MRKVIALVGVIGSGKDYRAQQLIKDGGFVKFGFSDGVREFCWDLLKWKPKNNDEYEFFKVSNITFMGNKLTGREFLQSVGSKMRELDPAFWAKYWGTQLESKFNNHDNIVIADCRYPEEVLEVVERSKQFDFEFKFIYCNFVSEKYELNEHHSEHMAQRYLTHKHGEDITTVIQNEIVNLKK